MRDELTLKRKGSGLLLPPRSIGPEEADLTQLTPAQRRFLLAFAKTHDVNDACELADVSRATYQRKWCSDDMFRASFAKLQLDILGSIRELALSEAYNSFERIVRLRDQEDDQRVALRAAEKVLNLTKDPSLTGENTAQLHAQTAFMRLMSKPTMVAALERVRRGENVIDGDYREPEMDKPDFYDNTDDREVMGELDAKSKLLRGFVLDDDSEGEEEDAE